MTQEELQTILQQIANEAVNVFNVEYNTNVDVTDDVFQDFLEAFSIIALFGWQSLVQSNYEGQTIKLLKKIFPREYEGSNKTTQERLRALLESEEVVDDQQLEQFFGERITEVLIGASLAVTQVTRALSAQEAGLYKFVGGLTVQDPSVRDKHRRHDKKYWKVGTYQPWFDYGDRCSYVWFASEQEAIKAGFTKL